MRDRRTGNGFKVADTSATKSNGAKFVRKETNKPDTLKSEPVKSNKRTAPAEEESEDELEDFGDVDIDIESDDDEEIQEGDVDDSDGDIDEFPEENEKDQDENTLVGEEGEEEEEEEESDDYMAGDSLDEEDWNEEVKTSEKKDSDKPDRLPEIEADYDSDSSTEDVENTVGKVPMEWYDDFPHIGYDIDGKRVLRPAKGDELEKFLSTMDDPDSWRSVAVDKEGKDVVLNDEELDIIRRLQGGDIPDAAYDPYEPTIEWFSSKKEVMPLSAAPEPKSRFIPSKWEAKKIMKIVRAIRTGRIVPRKPASEKPRFYNLWGDDEQPREDHIMQVPAPKMKLPDHDESYNPPEEYLPTEEEIKEWEELDPEDRPKNYLPQKFNSLRQVPAYNRFIQERFERCLDLYLAPRVRKNRLNIDPDSLIPKLPSPKDLQPFPTQQSISYEGHTGRIRCFSLDPVGLYMVSGSDDNTVKLWEISTGRCLKTWKFDSVIHSVAWNPNRELCVFAVSVGHGNVILIAPPRIGSPEQTTLTDQYFQQGYAAMSTAGDDKDAKNPIPWVKPSEEDQENLGYRVQLSHTQAVKQITWHRKGDYFATVAPDAKNLAVLIHQITKYQSQAPFRKLKGLVQRVMFHPIKPLFFVATQLYVRVYNLMKQELLKTLQSGVKWISSLDVHPGGDNVIVGSYDKRLCWFDLDLSSRPYKTLRYHSQAIRQVTFHKRYPLFASSSDDGSIQIFHGMVYNDLLQNPLIVPVKILRGHSVVSSLGVLDIEFHPTQPWILSSGADHTLRLWT
ncbi:hypothetical protein INT43_001078 [Umbelopsis isabellina]|uniref:Ribosome biogenesis protein ERB1 n=1 Tax=Mortierella isabellina TaxID=91625 RepID=A0A8H7U863_MORIS|nr:hypothetical protein INT43_001078 [Umbelopsis isabellina]